MDSAQRAELFGQSAAAKSKIGGIMVDYAKFNVRLIEKNFRKGLLSDREYQAFLRDLPDLEGNYDETLWEDLLPKGLIAKMVGRENPDEREESKPSGK